MAIALDSSSSSSSSSTSTSTIIQYIQGERGYIPKNRGFIPVLFSSRKGVSHLSENCVKFLRRVHYKRAPPRILVRVPDLPLSSVFSTR